MMLKTLVDGNKDAKLRHVFPGIQPASIHVFPEIQRGHKIRDTEQGFKLARIQKVLLIESAESQSPF